MRRAPLAGMLLAAGLLAGCSSQATEPEPAPTTQPAAGHGSYASCLSEHGVSTPPAGPGAPPGVDPQVWATAQQACADKAPGPTG